MRNRRSARRRMVVSVLVALCIVLLLAAVYHAGRWLEGQSERQVVRGDHLQRYQYEESVEIDGVAYRRKRNQTAILLMGIDRIEAAAVGDYRNGGQADFLRLVILDKDEQSIKQIQIDRDTMTPITVLGVLGNNSRMRTSQICLSHGFGDGGAQSCQFTEDAVSNLLLGVDIDFYVAMNLDGISVLNDWAGGVTVTLQDDFSQIDPSMTPGTVMTLVGDQAEIFVRTRHGIGVGTNESRMERQELYINQLAAQLDEKLTANQDAAGELYDVLSPYLITDMSRGRLINEVWAARSYAREPVIEIAGEYQIGSDGFMEFIADEDSIKQIVLDLFYVPVK